MLMLLNLVAQACIQTPGAAETEMSHDRVERQPKQFSEPLTQSKIKGSRRGGSSVGEYLSKTSEVTRYNFQ